MPSEIIAGKDHMVSANNQVPWHDQGTVIAGVPTAAEALVLAKLNWEILQEAVFDADSAVIKAYLLNRRSDNRDVLAIVNAKWRPLQNAKLLEIAEALAQVNDTDFKPVIETAGSLKGGRIVWALVQIGERDFGGSKHRQYLLLSMGHDGKRGIRGTLTDVRVVCWNTLSAAERDDAGFFVTHIGNPEARVATAVETLGWANDATRATFAIYEALAKADCSADKAHQFFYDLLPKNDELAVDDATMATMLELFKYGAGNEGKTYFDAVNAVTDYVDHTLPFRNTATRGETKFLNTALGGDGARLKVKALRRAASLVGAGS